MIFHHIPILNINSGDHKTHKKKQLEQKNVNDEKQMQDRAEKIVKDLLLNTKADKEILITIGASGSGKTYFSIGDTNKKVFGLLHYIQNELTTYYSNVKFTCIIYEIFAGFTNDDKFITLKHIINTDNPAEIVDKINKANDNRSTNTTPNNPESSRSHLCIEFKLEKNEKNKAWDMKEQPEQQEQQEQQEQLEQPEQQEQPEQHKSLWICDFAGREMVIKSVDFINTSYSKYIFKREDGKSTYISVCKKNKDDKDVYDYGILCRYLNNNNNIKHVYNYEEDTNKDSKKDSEGKTNNIRRATNICINIIYQVILKN